MVLFLCRALHRVSSIRPVSRASFTREILYVQMTSSTRASSLSRASFFKDRSAWGLLYKGPPLCVDDLLSVSMTSVHDIFSIKGIITVQRATLFEASSQRASSLCSDPPLQGSPLCERGFSAWAFSTRKVFLSVQKTFLRGIPLKALPLCWGPLHGASSLKI